MKNTINRIVGEKLFQLRVIQRLSLNDVADRVGISKSTLWRYENEDIDIGVKMLMSLLSVYNQDFLRFMIEVETELKNIGNTTQ